MIRVLAGSVGMVLSELCRSKEPFTPEQLKSAGVAARRLFEFAYDQEPRNAWLVRRAVESICATFGSNAAESTVLVLRLLEPDRMKAYAFEEMSWLANEVEKLMGHDPALVEAIYVAAFSHIEDSRETTQLGSGQIFGFTSTRVQDYHTALYSLSESFGSFLENSPVNATRAMVAAIDAYAKQQSNNHEDVAEQNIEFMGQHAAVKADTSSLWDENDLCEHDERLKLLNSYAERLQTLGADDTRRGEWRELINEVARNGQSAILWRRILDCGAARPKTIGRDIWELAKAEAILTTVDTYRVVGRYLRAVFELLSTDQRREIEQAILFIPEWHSSQSSEYAERVRTRLLNCLSVELVVTDEAKDAITELESADSEPPDDEALGPEFGPIENAYDEYLRRHNVDIDAEQHQHIRDLMQPIKSFNSKFLNDYPELSDFHEVLSSLRALHEGLQTADQDGVHEVIATDAWSALARACTRVSYVDGFTCESDIGSFIREALLTCASHSKPIFNQEREERFEQHPELSDGGPRVQAAEGILVLARNDTCANDAVFQMVAELANDEVASVRAQTARQLCYLYRTAPDLMWQLLESICLKEAHRTVVFNALQSPLRKLAGPHPHRITELLQVVANRITDGPGIEKIRERCVSIMVGLHLNTDTDAADQFIRRITKHPESFSFEALRVTVLLRGKLTYGPTASPDERHDRIRTRTIELFDSLLDSALRRLESLHAMYEDVPTDEVPGHKIDEWKCMARLVDSISSQLYFASGAHEFIRAESSSVKRDVRQRLLREAESIIDKLTNVRIARAVHYVVTMLFSFIDIDPRQAFMRICQVVRSGQQGGYQFEPLAADLIVKIVNGYLAQHPRLFRDDAEMRAALLEVLDIFVSAGWPATQRLVYRMDEIYR